MNEWATWNQICVAHFYEMQYSSIEKLLMSLTKEEIIDETVEYYSVDPKRRRSFNGFGSVCMYTDEDMENGCAVGRCLTDKTRQEILDKDMNDSSLMDIEYDLESIGFKNQYRGHSMKFWGGLQALHDSGMYWDDDGLSEAGKQYVIKLKNRFC